MTWIKIEQLIWDEYNTEHIKKHNITISEIEETLNNLLAHKRGKKGKLILIGRSKKRLISLVLGREERNTYYPVSVRDSDKKERRLVYEKENEK